jgi:hypothetical protein
MKNRFIFHSLPVFVWLLVAASCKNNKDKASVEYTISTYRGIKGSAQVLPHTALYFYGSLSDLKSEQHLKFTKHTNENGLYTTSEIIKGIDNPTDVKNYYFVDAKTDHLNTKRYYKNSGPHFYAEPYQLLTNTSSGMNGKDKKGNGSLTLYLSSTPTKLRLVVYHTGDPVEGASVQLYKTADDYNTQTTDRLPDPETGVYLPDVVYTDANGEVYFEDLEPRQYWFRITKGPLSNSDGTIHTDGVLTDDENITNQKSVGIN